MKIFPTQLLSRSSSPEEKNNTKRNVFVQCPGLGCFGERILGVFGLYSSSLSKSVGFVSLSGKASLVSISAAILFLRSWHVHFPLEFKFRGKSCVE